MLEPPQVPSALWETILSKLNPTAFTYLLICECFPRIPKPALTRTRFLQKGAASAIPSPETGSAHGMGL